MFASRRMRIATLIVGLMVAPFSGNAQPADKVLRIGVLLSFLAPGDEPLQAFRQRLSGLGYIEGKNITIEWRHADRGYDRLPELAEELVQLKSDVILTDVALATRAAMRATPSTPIVMAISADPVADGLGSSLARLIEDRHGKRGHPAFPSQLGQTKRSRQAGGAPAYDQNVTLDRVVGHSSVDETTAVGRRP